MSIHTIKREKFWDMFSSLRSMIFNDELYMLKDGMKSFADEIDRSYAVEFDDYYVFVIPDDIYEFFKTKEEITSFSDIIDEYTDDSKCHDVDIVCRCNSHSTITDIVRKKFSNRNYFKLPFNITPEEVNRTFTQKSLLKKREKEAKGEAETPIEHMERLLENVDDWNKEPVTSMPVTIATYDNKDAMIMKLGSVDNIKKMKSTSFTITATDGSVKSEVTFILTYDKKLKRHIPSYSSDSYGFMLGGFMFVPVENNWREGSHYIVKALFEDDGHTYYRVTHRY